ncbi:MAG: OmpA family protein [Deltaproteobacteria bacterium]|nr:OmpA family protein [Deltaproteobacteria bacterium]
MKRNGLIFLLVALLILPIFAVTFTACSKDVKKDTGLSDEEKARLEKERLAKEEEERRRAALAQYTQAKDVFQNEHIYFDFDRYNIRKDQEAKLRFKADFLAANARVAAEVQGHCDERGTNAYNMALGDRRAHSAKNYVESLGIPGSRMTAVSYGFERPVDPGHNEAAWSKNRRAQFAVTAE